MSNQSNHDARLMTWPSFKSTFLEKALNADVPISGAPPLILFASGGGTRLGLRLPSNGAAAPDLRLRSIRVARVGESIEVWSDDADVFQVFYSFLVDVANRVQLDNCQVTEAISESFRGFRDLLVELKGLSVHEQIGLSGELWTLARLLRAGVPDAVQAWTGPWGEAHDFRIAGTELEVKSTTGEVREHMISRIDQLQPSPDHDLFLLSLHFANAGSGHAWSLGGQIRELRDLLRVDVPALEMFDQAIERVGWQDDDDHIYIGRYQERQLARLVRVDGTLPAVTQSLITDKFGSEGARISEATYVLNVEGLGVEDGSSVFAETLPEKLS